MKVLIIRHGKTNSNNERRYSGCRIDDSLSAEGAAELTDCSDLLAGLGISEDKTVLITSPMKRARETAAIMFPEISDSLAIDDIREMDFGIFEGRNHEELDGDPVYQAWIDSMCTLPIPEGESKDSFTERTMKGFREAVRAVSADSDHQADSLIIVAHGGTIMSVMDTLFEGSYYDFYTLNGEGYIFDLEVDNAGNIIAAGAYDRFCGRVRA